MSANPYGTNGSYRDEQSLSMGSARIQAAALETLPMKRMCTNACRVRIYIHYGALPENGVQDLKPNARNGNYRNLCHMS